MVLDENWKTITVKKRNDVASYDNHNLPAAPFCDNEGNPMIITFQIFKQMFSFYKSFYLHPYMWMHIYPRNHLSIFIHSTSKSFMFVVITKSIILAIQNVKLKILCTNDIFQQVFFHQKIKNIIVVSNTVTLIIKTILRPQNTY